MGSSRFNRPKLDSIRAILSYNEETDFVNIDKEDLILERADEISEDT